ncbi:hypothetical protein J6590_009481 [Homalodisca vitripennis]|nr:hypothetical protein J6590_009481 [Homalodisca vitripennis]
MTSNFPLEISNGQTIRHDKNISQPPSRRGIRPVPEWLQYRSIKSHGETCTIMILNLTVKVGPVRVGAVEVSQYRYPYLGSVVCAAAEQPEVPAGPGLGPVLQPLPAAATTSGSVDNPQSLQSTNLWLLAPALTNGIDSLAVDLDKLTYYFNEIRDYFNISSLSEREEEHVIHDATGPEITHGWKAETMLTRI